MVRARPKRAAREARHSALVFRGQALDSSAKLIASRSHSSSLVSARSALASLGQLAPCSPYTAELRSVDVSYALSDLSRPLRRSSGRMKASGSAHYVFSTTNATTRSRPTRRSCTISPVTSTSVRRCSSYVIVREACAHAAVQPLRHRPWRQRPRAARRARSSASHRQCSLPASSGPDGQPGCAESAERIADGQ